MLSFLFLFKQKTAYEMRISDWSSDVCSSDLADQTLMRLATHDIAFGNNIRHPDVIDAMFRLPHSDRAIAFVPHVLGKAPLMIVAVDYEDRKSVVSGKSVSVSVDLGGRRIIKKKNKKKKTINQQR